MSSAVTHIRLGKERCPNCAPHHASNLVVLLLHIFNITIGHLILGLKNLFDKKKQPSLILMMSF